MRSIQRPIKIYYRPSDFGDQSDTRARRALWDLLLQPTVLESYRRVQMMGEEEMALRYRCMDPGDDADMTNPLNPESPLSPVNPLSPISLYGFGGYRDDGGA